jgi:hypothetical protein
VACVVLAAGAVGWAALSPGGIEARLTGIDSGLRNTVSGLTQNAALDKATKMFDGWYRDQGTYPKETQSMLDQDPNASWGAGMDVSWCTPRAVVLTSLTAAGTVSRLLIDGEKVGDLPGRVACPTDLVDPLPWKR